MAPPHQRRVQFTLGFVAHTHAEFSGTSGRDASDFMSTLALRLLRPIGESRSNQAMKKFTDRGRKWRAHTIESLVNSAPSVR